MCESKSTESDATQTSDVVYECVQRRGRTSLKELEYLGGRVKCPHCGYRVLKKTRPPIVKRVKAV